jgi:hypothetical protein
MDQIILLGAIGLVVFLGTGVVAWGIWLDYKRQQRLLDIIAAALAAGQEPPAEVLGKLAGEPSAISSGSPASRSLLRTIVVFMGLTLVFLLGAAAFGGKASEAFQLVSAIAGTTTLALLLVYSAGRRFGL